MLSAASRIKAPLHDSAPAWDTFAFCIRGAHPSLGVVCQLPTPKLGPLLNAACHSCLLWLPAECGHNGAVCQWVRRQALTSSQAEAAGECPASAASRPGSGGACSMQVVAQRRQAALWPAPLVTICLRLLARPPACLPACRMLRK